MAGRRRELIFEHLGREIATRVPGAQVLVVGNPFAVTPAADARVREAEAASERGLKRGLGDGGSLVGVVHPELTPQASANPSSVELPVGASTPLSFMTRPGAWDRFGFASVQGKTIWVSLIGFPADLAETRAWRDPEGPFWVCYQPDWRILGGREAIRDAFTRGRLLAAVLARPGAPPEADALGADAAAEFQRRCLLITRENVEEMLRAWPQLFP